MMPRGPWDHLTLQTQDSALQGQRASAVTEFMCEGQKDSRGWSEVGYWALSLVGAIPGGTQVWSWVRGEFTFAK